MIRLRNVVTSNFVVQLLLHLLRVKGLYFTVVLQEAKKIQKILTSRSKENTEDFKKYLMNVSHKFSEFGPPFSRKQKENQTCAVSKFVCNLYTYILTRN